MLLRQKDEQYLIKEIKVTPIKLTSASIALSQTDNFKRYESYITSFSPQELNSVKGVCSKVSYLLSFKLLANMFCLMSSSIQEFVHIIIYALTMDPLSLVLGTLQFQKRSLCLFCNLLIKCTDLMTFMCFNTFLFLLLMYKIEFGQNLPGSSLGKKTKLLKN